MTPAERERAAAAAARVEAPVTLLIGRGADPEQNGRVDAFAAAVCALAPQRLSSAVEQGRDPEGASLALGRDGRVPVRFRVVPEGLELGVFLGALEALGRAPRAAATLELAAPLSVEVMTLPACGHCAPVAAALCRLAVGTEGLRACVVDVAQAPQYVNRYRLTFTPAVIVNGKTFAGKRTEAELAAELAAIAAGQHALFSLAARLEEGQAGHIAARCLAEGRLAPGLCSLVVAENFQTRLGAIVALQEVAGKNPELAAQAVAEVAVLLADGDPRNRGDAAYVLGELGRPEALPHLERLLADADPAVVEAAQEALAALGRRRG